MSNPLLNPNNFRQREDNVLEAEIVRDDYSPDKVYYGNSAIAEPMTIQGTISKILMLLACVVAGAVMNVYFLLNGNQNLAVLLMGGGGIVAFILVLIASFKPMTAKYLAAPYALFEGFVIGGVSALFEASYRGIVIHSVFATFAVLFVMLMLYKARIIQYSDKMGAVLKTGILSICAVYLIQFVASFFGRSIPGIFESGPVGILFSLIVIGFASFCFIQDFFIIERSANSMLPKDYEWFGALGLMVTLIWLYMEILRLFAKLNSRR